MTSRSDSRASTREPGSASRRGPFGHRAQDSSPNPLPPEATGAPPSAKSLLYKVASAAFSGALVVLLVIWFRDQLDEYGS